MSDSLPAESGWRAFWNRGGWWRALILVAVYAVLYQFIPFLWSSAAESATADGVFASAASVFFGLGAPVMVGSAILLVFSWTVGWIPRPLFTKQPVYRSWWMWIAVILVALPIVLRLLGIDYASYGAAVVAMSFVTGLFVGLAEELLFRGLVVQLLRKAGNREWAVAALSSLFFALMHTTNIFQGQAISTVGNTLVYTFAFGVLMYLVMRVTGNLIWAIILHGLTDPTGFLAVGGVDEAGAGHAGGASLAFVGPVTILLIIGGFVLLIFIRGKAGEGKGEKRDVTARKAS